MISPITEPLTADADSVLTLPQFAPAGPAWRDRAGRTIGYLRLSLTKACSMRCTYCRPETLRHVPEPDRMTPAEIESVVRHLVARYGVHKVRLTGGEPTLRPDFLEILERLSAVPGLDDLATTTNGLTLAKHAAAYAKAGLGRVNISLDSLNPETFARLTGVDRLGHVLDGIDAALDAGLGPVKLNTVVVRGENLHDLPALVSYAADKHVPLRFIEMMPMGPLAASWSERYVAEAEMRQTLAPMIAEEQLLSQGADAARRYRVTLRDGRTVELGYITPMSCDFCAACDRLRLSANGGLFPCLMDEPRGSALSAIRPHFDGDAFDRLLQAAYDDKQATHPPAGPTVMTHIGG